MKSWMKAIGGLVAVLVVLIITAIVLPFVIDLNKFKPQIQNAVSDKVNAKVEFESARLTILTGLGVKLKKVSIENTDSEFSGTRLFYVDDLYFHVELWPLLKKKVIGYIEINRPEILVARRGLKNNIAVLPKPAAEGSGSNGSSSGGANTAPPSQKAPPKTPADEPKTAEQIQKQKDTIEDLKKNVVLKTLEIKNASVTIKDFQTTGAVEPLKISDLNILVNNIGVDRDIHVSITTETAVNEPGVRVSGPIEVLLTTQVNLEGTQFKKATFKGKFDLDKLNINARDAFVKSSSIPLNLSFDGSATPNTVEIDKANLRLHSVDVDAKVSVSDLKTLQTLAQVGVNSKDLQKLGDLLPQHKNLLLNASLDLNASVSGPLSKPMSVKSKLDLKTILSGSDLALNWQSERMEPIVANVLVKSQRLDVGALVKPFLPPPGEKDASVQSKDAPAPGKAQSPGAAPNSNSQAGTAQVPNAANSGNATGSAAKEFELTPEQKKLLENSNITIKANMGEILYDKVKIENLVLDGALQGLSANLRQFSLNIFGGNMNADGMVNLSSAPLPFRTHVSLNKIRAEQLVAFIKPEQKQVLEGGVSLDLKLDGRGTTLPTLSKTLNGMGRFVFADGELHTQSVAKLAQQKFDGFVGGLSIVAAADTVFANAQKILDNPLVKQMGAAKGFDLAKYKQQYDTVRNVKISDKAADDRTLKNVNGTLEIKQGRIYITSQKSGSDGSIALNSSVGLDLTLGGDAVFTASETTKQKMLAQSKYANLLFEDGNALSLRMLLGGTVSEPAVNIDFAPIEARFKKNAQALVDKEIRKQTDDLLKGKMDAALEQLKNKQKELEAKSQEELKKLENDTKTKAKAEADKFLKKNKDKLKGIFGG